MKDIWRLLIIITIFIVFIGGACLGWRSYEDIKCNDYKKIGLETKVDFNNGCQVLLDNEFITIYEFNKYLKFRELEKRLDALSREDAK